MRRRRPLRPALLLLAAGLLAACQPALFTGVNLVAPKATDQVADGLVFAPGKGLALDLYLPEIGDSPPPLVVFFYGGSWQHGERHWYAFVGQALARHGLAVAIPDYRKAPFPAFMADAAEAVAWLKAQGPSLGYDPDRIVLMGHSAGAQIAALLATDPQYLARHDLSPSDLAGVIGLAGPYDFLPIRSRPLREVFGDDPARHRASQPIAHIDGSEPPFLLLHGRDDRVVEPGNSMRMAERLRAHQVPVQLQLVPDTGHAGLALLLARPAGRGRATLESLIQFVGRVTSRITASAAGHPPGARCHWTPSSILTRTLRAAIPVHPDPTLSGALVAGAENGVRLEDCHSECGLEFGRLPQARESTAGEYTISMQCKCSNTDLALRG